jgi:hypothetical protein
MGNTASRMNDLQSMSSLDVPFIDNKDIYLNMSYDEAYQLYSHEFKSYFTKGKEKDKEKEKKSLSLNIMLLDKLTTEEWNEMIYLIDTLSLDELNKGLQMIYAINIIEDNKSIKRQMIYDLIVAKKDKIESKA